MLCTVNLRDATHTNTNCSTLCKRHKRVHKLEKVDAGGGGGSFLHATEEGNFVEEGNFLGGKLSRPCQTGETLKGGETT